VSDLVLIVDDSLTVRMDLADAFEAAGFRAIPCANAAEARQALANESPVLVVLDVLLPDADGVELLEEFRQGQRGNLPIVMLSAEAEVTDRIRGLSKGADDYVGKPYDRDYVVARGRELARQREASAGLGTVLVVDDSVTFRQALSDLLAHAGYRVHVAGSGEEGIKIAARVRPRAILVDGVLPGMDGAAFIRTIRLDAALRATPCLLLTGSDDVGAELRALDAGADAFLRKGEANEVVLARLEALCRKEAGSDADIASLAGPKRVLVVDDSPTYLEEIASLLRDEGYDVVLARSGEEAIELLAVQSPDCILLDLMMPGLGGQETCRRIKASPARDIPLLMITAREEREAMLENLGTGADDYISKASDFEVLKARVRAQLRRKQFEDENRRIRENLLRSEIAASEARAQRELAETRAALVEELEKKNAELEAFSYSVSHDLRAPLRSIDGFSLALLEDYETVLDDRGRDYLQRVRGNAQRMGELIDDMLELSRVSRVELRRQHIDLSALARDVVDELLRRDPRELAVSVEQGLECEGDGRLLRVLFENLLGNAFKFSQKCDEARVHVGAHRVGSERHFFVRDNGAGFDPIYADKLFKPFQRLHTQAEFPGTGIGLATVARIVDRHGGRVWAEAQLGEGATVWFVLDRPRGVA
jgi:two-component system, NtrC family, sensor kinase